jgi:SAM-dependent methyltransferase
MIDTNNKYSIMQRLFYDGGTTNHENHNLNTDYWDILLGDLKDKEKWKDKIALDFACGKGRNVTNMFGLCEWARVDGVDISASNIQYNRTNYENQNSKWYLNNGVDVSDLKTNEYDFIMSTIALQHICVYDIRKSLIIDLLRTLKPGSLFSFQMGYGKEIYEYENRIPYFDNFYDANGTNSLCDVRVQSEQDVINDLTEIGFVNITTEIRNKFDDDGHPQWIYVKAYKPK